MERKDESKVPETVVSWHVAGPEDEEGFWTKETAWVPIVTGKGEKDDHED